MLLAALEGEELAASPDATATEQPDSTFRFEGVRLQGRAQKKFLLQVISEEGGGMLASQVAGVELTSGRPTHLQVMVNNKLIH